MMSQSHPNHLQDPVPRQESRQQNIWPDRLRKDGDFVRENRDQVKAASESLHKIYLGETKTRLVGGHLPDDNTSES